MTQYPATAPRCLSCGYQLVGLSVEGACPECGAPVWQSNRPVKTSGFAITSMVLGILSIVSCFMYGIPSIVLGPLGLIFGFLAMKQINAGTHGGSSRGMAIAGLVCSGVGSLLALVVIGLIIFALLA